LSPRWTRKAACGSRTGPRLAASGRMASSSSLRPMIAPPITSPCPAAYLVRLWTYRSTSNCPWLWNPAKVLSSTVSAPAARAAAVIRAISATLVTGLVGLSKMTSRVGREARSEFNTLVVLDRQHRVLDPELAEHPPDEAARRPVGLDEAQHVVAGALHSDSNVVLIAATPEPETMQSSRPCRPATVSSSWRVVGLELRW
jgi:hypothetical protein